MFTSELFYALILSLPLSCTPPADVREFREQLRQDLADGRRELEALLSDGGKP